MSLSTVLADLGIENGKILSVDAYRGDFFDRLLQPMSFVNVGMTDVDMVCTKTSKSGELSHISGSVSSTGWMCKNGQYIAFRAFDNNSDNLILKDQYLFDNLWYKSNDEDVLQWSNYYLKDKNFNFYYECYTCVNATTEDNEPGCLNADATACIAKKESGCDVWYGYESICLEKLGEKKVKPETHWYDFFIDGFDFNTSLQLTSLILALVGSGLFINHRNKMKKGGKR
jgi:hypothetical protein